MKPIYLRWDHTVAVSAPEDCVLDVQDNGYTRGPVVQVQDANPKALPLERLGKPDGHGRLADAAFNTRAQNGAHG